MSFPADLRYTNEHEWLRLNDDGTATVGITHYAQSELGDIVFVDLEDGADGTTDDTFGSVEAVKTVSDLFFPVAGRVIEINDDLDGSPELVNSDPYGAGWMIRMEVKDPSEADQLMDAEAYKAMVAA